MYSPPETNISITTVTHLSPPALSGLNSYTVNTSFSHFEPFTLDLTSDLPSYYSVHNYSDGHRWELRLYDIHADMIIDTIDLQGHIRDVSPIWYDHLVLNYVFDRNDWNDDATEEEIAWVKAFYESKNKTRLEDFITEHNSSFQDTAMYERLANNMAY